MINKRGFTLLELMIVLAIMGILIYPLGNLMIKAMRITAMLNKAVYTAQSINIVSEKCYEFTPNGNSNHFKVVGVDCM